MATLVLWVQDSTPGACDVSGHVYQGRGPTATSSGDVQELPDGVAQVLFDAGYVAFKHAGYWHTRHGVVQQTSREDTA